MQVPPPDTNNQPDAVAAAAASADASSPEVSRVETTPKERWRSEELLGNRCEVLIEHQGELYRLRRTRQGKLILHK